mgnify:CR=1 FL=1
MADELLYSMRKKGENDVLIYSDRVELVGAHIDGSNAVFELCYLVPGARTPDDLRHKLLVDGFTQGGRP